MEKIVPGKYVELGYDLYKVNPDGSEKLMHQTDKSDPEKIIFGVTRGMIEPLEKAIDGLEIGSKFNVSATPSRSPPSKKTSSWSTANLTTNTSCPAPTCP